MTFVRLREFLPESPMHLRPSGRQSFAGRSGHSMYPQGLSLSEFSNAGALAAAPTPISDAKINAHRYKARGADAALTDALDRRHLL